MSKSKSQIIIESVGYICLIISVIYGFLDGFSSAIDFLDWKKSLFLSIASFIIWISVIIFFRYKNYSWEDEGVQYKYITPANKFHLLFFSTIVAFWIPLMFSSESEENKLSKPEVIQKYPNSRTSLFQSDSTYNILLLPFGSSQNCKDETVICEREVESRFNLIKSEDKSLNIEVQLYEGENTKTRSLSFERAKSLGDSLGAKLVVWGDYRSKCKWDSTKIRVKWANVQQDIPFLKKNLKGNYQSIEDLAKIEQGDITGDVEDIVYWGLGLEAMDNHYYRKADSLFRKIKVKPRKEYSIVYFMIANCASHPFEEKTSSRINKAIRYYSKAITLDPEYDGAYMNRGISNQILKRYDEAISDYTKAFELNPKDFHVLINRGGTYFLLKRYDDAINDFTKVIELNPKYSGGYYNRGRCYATLKRYNYAISDYTKAIELNPKNARALHNRGGIYHVLEEYEKAINDYTMAISLNPNFDGSYLNRGLTYKILGRFDNAIDDFTKTINFDPKNSKAHYNRGRCYQTLNKIDNALADFTKAIELNPNDDNTYSFRGITFMDLEKYDNALADFTKAIELNPNDANAYSIRGGSYLALERHESSVTDFTKAIELNPQVTFYYYNRGIGYAALKKYSNALTDFTKAIELNPEFVFALYNRGRTYQELKKHDDAIVDFTKAIELNPKDSDAYNSLGYSFLKKGQLVKAKVNFEKAEYIDNKNYLVYRNWTCYYALHSKEKLAFKNLKKAIYFGFSDVEWLRKEISLNSIRESSEFKDLVSSISI